MSVTMKDVPEAATQTAGGTDWPLMIAADPDQAALWRGWSACLRHGMKAEWRQAVLERLPGLELSSAPARLYQAVLLLTQLRTSAAASRAAQALADMKDPHVAREWSFLALLWGMSIEMTQRSQVAGMLRAADADGLAQRVAGRVMAGIQQAAATPGIRTTSRHPGRVAVVAPHLAGGRQAATRLALEHAGLLQRAGREVKIFSAQDMFEVNAGYWLGSDLGVEIGPAEPETWQPVLSTGPLQVFFADGWQPVAARWLQVLTAVRQFEPEVVLYVGFCSPLLDMLWRLAPTVALSTYSLPPLGRCDLWLHGYESDDTRPPSWREQDQPLPFHYPFRLPSGRPEGKDWRALLGLGDRRVMISVGVRLSQEIASDFATQILALLDTHPGWVWVLVGDPALPDAIASGHAAVIHLGPQTDIRGLLDVSDIYLNPPRMGGGFSVIEAMEAGLPVVSLDNSDGGQKIGSSAARDMDDYREKLNSLMENPQRRYELGAENKKKFDSRFNLENAAPQLLVALSLACERRNFRAAN